MLLCMSHVQKLKKNHRDKQKTQQIPTKTPPHKNTHKNPSPFTPKP